MRWDEGPSEGKDVILFSRGPSPAPFFVEPTPFIQKEKFALLLIAFAKEKGSKVRRATSRRFLNVNIRGGVSVYCFREN